MNRSLAHTHKKLEKDIFARKNENKGLLNHDVSSEIQQSEGMKWREMRRERWQGPKLKAKLRTGLDFSSVMWVEAAKGVKQGKGKGHLVMLWRI